MRLVYIDDSHDTLNYCFSALLLPAENWNAHFAYLKGLRSALKQSDGIHTKYELHATKFLGGRGRPAGNTIIIPKSRRVVLYNWYLDQLAVMPDLSVMHVCMANEYTAFERLLNRIERTMVAWDDLAIIISDQGKSYDSMLRRMRYKNMIPSSRTYYPEGHRRNIPIQRIIEDIVYRDSKQSLFIQAADFTSYALLRFLSPTQAATRHGFDQSLKRIEPVIFKNANPRCRYAMGIIGK